MAKNSVEAYGAAGKSNVLSFDPDALVLVTDKSSPLYNPRVDDPIDPARVKNVKRHGVIEPVIVTKNVETGKTEVVAGRQRVKWARAANAELREEGKPLLMVPAIVRTFRKGDPGSLTEIMIAENENRAGDTPIVRAEKMARLVEFGRSPDLIAIVFGCSEQTVKATLSLLECTTAVQNAVEKGEVNVGHALKLAKLPPEEQRGKLNDLKAAGNGASGHAKARAQRAVVSEPVARMRTRKDIQARLDGTLHPEARKVLQWVLGGEA
jgi:ParB family chromosome partitioning protein